METRVLYLICSNAKHALIKLNGPVLFRRRDNCSAHIWIIHFQTVINHINFRSFNYNASKSHQKSRIKLSKDMNWVFEGVCEMFTLLISLLCIPSFLLQKVLADFEAAVVHKHQKRSAQWALLASHSLLTFGFTLLVPILQDVWVFF